MTGIDLKRFTEYLSKLTDFANGSGVRIKRQKLRGIEGVYYPRARIIKLDRDLSESDEIATLLHELGHSLDDALTPRDTETRLDKALNARRPTKLQKRLIMKCEHRAWKFALGIARQLRIPLGKWFYDYKKECLDSYKNNQ